MSRSISIDVDLDEFETADIVKHLTDMGYTVTGNGTDSYESPLGDYYANGTVQSADRTRVFTLSVSGQTQAARELACQIVGDAIGRPL